MNCQHHNDVTTSWSVNSYFKSNSKDTIAQTFGRTSDIQLKVLNLFLETGYSQQQNLQCMMVAFALLHIRNQAYSGHSAKIPSTFMMAKNFLHRQSTLYLIRNDVCEYVQGLAVVKLITHNNSLQQKGM